MIRQPELGIRICELRKQKGITQKELADNCNVDIRTIQRIETGDVSPRMSTLKLIAEALSCEISDFNSAGIDHDTADNKLLAFFILGIIYFVSWVFTTILALKNILPPAINLFTSIVYAVTGTLFYYSFFYLGKKHGNIILQIASIMIMICIPIFLISLLIAPINSFASHVNYGIVLILSLNGIIFGIGLVKMKGAFVNWYKIAGILQILTVPFFIFRIGMLYIIGLWITVPFLVLLLIIVFLEYKS